MSWTGEPSPDQATANWHTAARVRDEAYLTLGAADDTETTDGPRSGRATTSVVPTHIHAAIHAGHIGQVTIVCDGCALADTADYTGDTSEARFDAARRHLAETKSWTTIPEYDGCPDCPPCEQCKGTRAAGVCCSSHNKHLCHLCYRRAHFVEVCVARCLLCAAEGLPVNLSDLGGGDPATVAFHLDPFIGYG